MQRGKNTNRVERYTSPDHLHIGLYVHLDLPWFRHPFTLSSFKIASEGQIQELRALKKARFRYDPALSEAPEAAGALPAAPIETATPIAKPAPAINNDFTLAMPVADPRVQQLRDYRLAVAHTEKSFMKAVGVVHRLNKNLKSRPTETLEEMGDLVEQMVTVFLERPEVALQIMGETCGGEEVYHHSLNVSVVCMMLVKGLNLGREQAEFLGKGALLHDIGLIKVPGQIVKKDADEQTRQERELYAKHVEHGIRIGAELGLAPEILAIIGQHHELADGSGYPRGLKLEQIAPLGRIVSLVNYYDGLCNPVDVLHALTPHEALAFMFAKSRSKFDAEILQIMIRALGVYPPGSIVKLSNDTTAMVVSVNPHATLRPWVVVYDAGVRRDDAPTLNLETERELSISKAIRPALLPAKVFAYLSPRKRITYYFDCGLPTAGAGK